MTSSLPISLALALSACAETRITDHAARPVEPVPAAARSGRTLLVVETALPAAGPDRVARAAEASALVRAAFADATAEAALPDGEAALLARARARDFDRVLVVRVEEYARHGALHIGPALPPVVWETYTNVSLRVRALDVRTGAVIADVRRDRQRGGVFALRSADDLPDELNATIRSLVPVDGQPDGTAS